MCYLPAHFIVIGIQFDMKSKLRLIACLAVFGAAMVASSASFAQPTAGEASPEAQAKARWAERKQAHRADRAKALHDILNIQPGQEAAFQTFLASLKADRPGRPADADKADKTALTTPQRLDRLAARLAARQAEFQRRADAIRTFYAVLTPDQQRAFDALPGLVGFGGGRGGPRGPGGGFKGPHGGA